MLISEAFYKYALYLLHSLVKSVSILKLKTNGLPNFSIAIYVCIHPAIGIILGSIFGPLLLLAIGVVICIICRVRGHHCKSQISLQIIIHALVCFMDSKWYNSFLLFIVKLLILNTWTINDECL